uniref:PB1 domain-containing protein n=1 Tax=Peronospora matthiolae TaxID=2874970 RepID=A0AAV1TW40_9STRA
MVAKQTELKNNFKGELHYLRVNLMSFSLKAMKALFAETFNLAPEGFVVQYMDVEGDSLNVTWQVKYEEACRISSPATSSATSVRLRSVACSAVAFKDKLSAPIFKFIENPVKTLNRAIIRVKHGYGRQGAVDGADKVDQTNEALKTVVLDT